MSCCSPTVCPPVKPALYFFQGINGQPGPLAVLCGPYVATNIYYENANRRDVVTYNGFAYAANAAAKNGTNTWGTPSDTGGDWVNIGIGSALVSTNSAHATANATGNSTVFPTTANHTEAMTFSGVAGARVVALDTTGSVAGDICVLVMTFPATAGLIITVNNATVGGTQLLPTSSGFVANAYTTDGATLSATWTFFFNPAGAWQYLSGSSPS